MNLKNVGMVFLIAFLNFTLAHAEVILPQYSPDSQSVSTQGERESNTAVYKRIQTNWMLIPQNELNNDIYEAMDWDQLTAQKIDPVTLKELNPRDFYVVDSPTLHASFDPDNQSLLIPFEMSLKYQQNFILQGTLNLAGDIIIFFEDTAEKGLSVNVQLFDYSQTAERITFEKAGSVGAPVYGAEFVNEVAKTTLGQRVLTPAFIEALQAILRDSPHFTQKEIVNSLQP